MILVIILVLLDQAGKKLEKYLNGVKLEKIFDINMYLFIEKGLRGGISYIAKRYSKANNKYMKHYDPKKPSKFIFLMVNLSG